MYVNFDVSMTTATKMMETMSTLFCVACVASVSVRFWSKERGTRVKNGFWLSFHFSRGQNLSFFAPKPNGNACYAGYILCNFGGCVI